MSNLLNLFKVLYAFIFLLYRTMRRLTLHSRLIEELKNEKLLYTNQQLENLSSSGSLKEARSPGMLNLGCPILNKFFDGGLPFRGITEIAGESSSGKTQICLQLAVMVRSPAEKSGPLGAVLFVCTEDPFPIKRLCQLTASNTKQVMDGIIIEHIEDIEGLQTCFEKKLPILARQHNIKLLVIDSIAAPFRCHYGVSDAAHRARKLYSIGDMMHRINEEFGIAVVCVNQVTDVINDDTSKSFNRISAPSLGLAWSNIVNTRIFVSRTTSVLGEKDSHLVVRKLAVVFSPYFPPSWCYFVINSSGVRGLKENETCNL